MNEQEIVEKAVSMIKKRGYKFATEIANLYRSADIVVIDNEDKVWVIECKVSSIGKAITQLKTHRLTADKVYICTPYKRTRKSTLAKIAGAGIGLIYINKDGSSELFLEPYNNKPWALAREKLYNKVMERV